MKIREMMTSDVHVFEASQTILEACKKMDEMNIGSIPVRQGDRLVGMITDRDIVTKVIARGLDPAKTKVSQCMRSPIVYAFDDQEINEAAEIMKSKKIRRLPVVNRQKRLVGFVSLSDISSQGRDEKLAGEVLKNVTAGYEPATHYPI